MSGRGTVTDSGLSSRPDDKKQLFRITTDAISDDSVYIAADSIDPPVTGDKIEWRDGYVIRLRDGARWKRIGYAFDD